MVQVEMEAILVRLDGIDRALQRIEESRLEEIQQHLRTLNGRVGNCEKWQAGADQMIDSINERIAENSDHAEKAEAKVTDLIGWVNQQKGWNSGRTQMIVQVSMLIGMAVTLIKIVFFHS